MQNKLISLSRAAELKEDAAFYQQAARLEANDAFYYVRIGARRTAARCQNRAYAYTVKAQAALTELIHARVEG